MESAGGRDRRIALGRLAWGVRWRPWRNDSPHGGWAGEATRDFWDAWRHGKPRLEAEGIGVRKAGGSWWVLWRGDGKTTLQSLILARREGMRRAVAALCDRDIDRARVRNASGFNRWDSRLGHQLGSLREWGAAHDEQAALMLRKYHRQISPEDYRAIYGEIALVRTRSSRNASRSRAGSHDGQMELFPSTDLPSDRPTSSRGVSERSADGVAMSVPLPSERVAFAARQRESAAKGIARVG